MIMKPLRNEDVLMKQVGSESMLYKTNDKAVHVLNPTAKLIWEYADGTHTIADIAVKIRANFAVPTEHDVTVDIKNTVQLMEAKGLLTLSE